MKASKFITAVLQRGSRQRFFLPIVYEMEKKKSNKSALFFPPDANMQNVNTPSAEASGQAGNEVCSLVGE